jgi:hypothetical protein
MNFFYQKKNGNTTRPEYTIFEISEGMREKLCKLQHKERKTILPCFFRLNFSNLYSCVHIDLGLWEI